MSVSPGSSSNWLVTEVVRLWPARKAGEDGRGDRYGEDIRDWNLRSKGLNDGVGLLKPGLEANDGSTLLLGEAEDIKEP